MQRIYEEYATWRMVHSTEVKYLFYHLVSTLIHFTGPYAKLISRLVGEDEETTDDYDYIKKGINGMYLKPSLCASF